MKRRLFALTTTAAAITVALAGASAFAQTKWDLPAGYGATNFHTANITEFANDVDKATGGKLKITVHANGTLFKAPEIKRAVQGGQAQAGEILLANFQNEWPLFGVDGLPFLADSYEQSLLPLISAMNHKMRLDHSIWDNVRETSVDIKEIEQKLARLFQTAGPKADKTKGS